MFVFFIVMLAAMHFHALLVPESAQAVSPWAMGWLVTLPRVAVALLYWLMVRATRRRLGTPRGAMAMRWLDRLRRLYHLALLALFLSDLRLGLLDALRTAMGGDWVLADELLVLLPTLAMLAWRWRCDHAIECHLRQAMLMRRLDAGLPPLTMPTAGQYVWAQLRQQTAMVLVPLLLLRGWGEVVDHLPQGQVMGLVSVKLVAMVAGVATLLALLPWLMRHLLDTRPLADGPMRRSLEALCQAHGVRVRELLVWRTGGVMVNAAVVGLLPGLRYILLTDALLDNVPQRQVEAVMAHEVGHVRRRHLLWRGVAAVAILLTVEMGVHALLAWVVHGPAWPLPWRELQGFVQDGAGRDVLAVALVLAGWLLAFGWVSRRYERQADTFAVQHLARQDALAGDVAIDIAGRPVIAPSAVTGMTGALDRLVELNRIPPRRGSWMHGSIHWRQTYLIDLIGRPGDGLPIDRLVRGVNLAAMLLLVGAAVVHGVVLPWLGLTAG